MEKTSDLAIVGAGVSGLAAAWQSSQDGISSTIFEKSRGLSGRAATRRREGSHFDHGANFFRLEDRRVESLLQEKISNEDLVQIPREVWTFSHEGKVVPGDPQQNAIPKWTYREGISTVGKRLLADSPLTEVRREVRIGEISRSGRNWALADDRGNFLGEWPRLLLTPPPPQLAELLKNSKVALDLAESLARLTYHCQFTLVLAFSAEVLSERPFHALVNSDAKHPIAWLGFEEDKPGHVPSPASILVVQMSPTWSAEHYETPPAEWQGEVIEMVEQLLGCSLPGCAWTDSQRWRFAHPKPGNELPQEIRTHYENEGLFLAGDGMVGKGRLPLALKSGLEVADRISLQIGSVSLQNNPPSN